MLPDQVTDCGGAGALYAVLCSIYGVTAGGGRVGG